MCRLTTFGAPRYKQTFRGPSRAIAGTTATRAMPATSGNHMIHGVTRATAYTNRSMTTQVGPGGGTAYRRKRPPHPQRNPPTRERGRVVCMRRPCRRLRSGVVRIAVVALTVHHVGDVGNGLQPLYVLTELIVRSEVIFGAVYTVVFDHRGLEGAVAVG